MSRQFVVQLKNEPGSLANLAERLAAAGIRVPWGVVVDLARPFRPTDLKLPHHGALVMKPVAQRALRWFIVLATVLFAVGVAFAYVIVLPAAIQFLTNFDDTLYDAFGQRQISTIYTQRNQYQVVLEIDPKFQSDPTDLERIYVDSSSGAPA